MLHNFFSSFFFFLLLLRLLEIGFKFCCFQRHQSMTVLNLNPTGAIFIYKYSAFCGRPGNFRSGLMKLSCILVKLLSLSGHFVSLRWGILCPKKFWQEFYFFVQRKLLTTELTPKEGHLQQNTTGQASFVPNLCYNFNSGFQLWSECYFWRLLHR